MIATNQELRSYMLRAQGISRSVLNTMALIGLFVFGWLIVVVFKLLGKAKQGWIYLIPMFIILPIARQSAPALGILAVLIYIGAWIHANMILSRYQSAARKRITEINRSDGANTNAVLEKGVLLHKALGDSQSAVRVLAKAFAMPGGDAALLNQAGIVMFAGKRYREAAQFFDRALSSPGSSGLIKQISRNRAAARKRMS